MTAASAAHARAAAAYLRENGWRQFGDHPGCKSRCLLHVLWEVGAGREYQFGSYLSASDKAVRLALQRLLGTDGLSFWNDTPGRTAAEVIAALEAVAEDLELEGRDV